MEPFKRNIHKIKGITDFYTNEIRDYLEVVSHDFFHIQIQDL